MSPVLLTLVCAPKSSRVVWVGPHVILLAPSALAFVLVACRLVGTQLSLLTAVAVVVERCSALACVVVLWWRRLSIGYTTSKNSRQMCRDVDDRSWLVEFGLEFES